MGLKELPVVPSTESDGLVKATYLDEYANVKNSIDLMRFARRWKPLFKLLLDSPSWATFAGNAKTKAAYESLCTGKFDFDEAWRCAQESTNGVCEHAHSYSCIGIHIRLPFPLIYADNVAKLYGVTTDVALIQLNGGFTALE